MSTRNKTICLALLLSVWALLHIPVLNYGTQKVPITKAYIGDEQYPINGSLRILSEKNMLGLRDGSSGQYGPVFSVIPMPAIAANYAALRYLDRAVSDAGQYREYLYFDYGQLLYFVRWISVLWAVLGLVGIWKILSSSFINPAKSIRLPILGTSLVATNYFYFMYSHQVRHWIFISVAVVWQLYFIFKTMTEDRWRNYAYASLLSVMAFGISYIAALFQLSWLPVLYLSYRKDRRDFWKKLAIISLVSAAGYSLMFIWNPGPLLRIAGIWGQLWGVSSGGDVKQASGFLPSLWPYLKIMAINQPLIVASMSVMIWVAIKNKLRPNNIALTSMAVPAMVILLLLSTGDYYQARYVFIQIIVLILSALVLFAAISRGDYPQKKPIVTFISFLLVGEVLLHVVHDVRWAQLMHQGPEENGLISEISERKAVVYMEDQGLLGGMHTSSSLMSYFNDCAPSWVLLKKIAALKPPADSRPLDVVYSCHGKDDGSKRTAKYQIVPTGYSIPDEFFQRSMYRLWRAKDYRKKFVWKPI